MCYPIKACESVTPNCQPYKTGRNLKVIERERKKERCRPQGPKSLSELPRAIKTGEGRWPSLLLHQQGKSLILGNPPGPGKAESTVALHGGQIHAAALRVSTPSSANSGPLHTFQLHGLLLVKIPTSRRKRCEYFCKLST